MKLATSTNIMNADRGRLCQIPMEQAVSMCSQAGYQYLDANISRTCRPHQPLTQYNWEHWAENIRQLGEELGVSFIQSHSYWIEGNCIGEDLMQKDPELSDELMKRSVLAAQRLGVKWAVVHPVTVRMGKGYHYKKSFMYNREYYKRWGEFYANHHVGMAIENLFCGHETFYYCADPDELLELVESIDNPAVQICIDTGHAHLTGLDTAAFIRKAGMHLKATHIADNHQNRDEHFAPFNGTIDWPAVLTALREMHYQEAFAFEIHNLTSAYPAQVQKSLVQFSCDLGKYLLGL